MHNYNFIHRRRGKNIGGGVVFVMTENNWGRGCFCHEGKSQGGGIFVVRGKITGGGSLMMYYFKSFNILRVLSEKLKGILDPAF